MVEMLTPICSAAALVDKSVLFDNSASLILFKPIQHFSILSHYKTHQYMLREERGRKSTRDIVETVTAQASVTPLGFVCRRAVRTGHASAGHRGLGRSVGAVGRCGARGREGHAGSGRHASQPGAAGSMAVARVFATPLRSPASRVCSTGGAQPRSPSMLPACAGTQGRAGACVFATAESESESPPDPLTRGLPFRHDF